MDCPVALFRGQLYYYGGVEWGDGGSGLERMGVTGEGIVDIDIK